jgi:Na+-translocating ferredoxin:NAD+ oxidoreductase RnfD subunit
MTSEAGSHLTTPQSGPPQRLLRSAQRLRLPRTQWITHSGMHVSNFVAMHILGAVFPLSAGLLLYGWRALGVIVGVCASTAFGLALWRRVGRRGGTLRYDHAMWMALLLALTLPAHLFATSDAAGLAGIAPWPIIPAAGITLAILMWALGTSGSGRVHAVLVVHLLLVVLFRDMLVPHYTLQRMNLFRGDVLNAATPREVRPAVGNEGREITLPWIRLPNDYARDALYSEPASQRLIFYTTGTESPERTWVSLEGLLRDRMPPLENLIVGGQPGPIGTSSAIAVIVGGLFLLYRGLIDYRVPLLIFLGAYLALLLLPIPVRITERDEAWQWFIARPPPNGVGWQVALTFVHYELMASPLLFMAFFLATAPAVRPMARRGRAVYALLVGCLAAVFQLYMAVSIGPYLALLAVSMLTPVIDRLFRPRTLV